MTNRRSFLLQTGTVVVGSLILPAFTPLKKRIKNSGIQLYTFRKDMLEDAKRTLQKISTLGIKQIESAASEKGNYYGLSPKEMKDTCSNLGMTLRSGHVRINKDWQKTIDEAAASGQEFLICSSMPTEGQTVDNYKRVAEVFNKSGEACKKQNIKFGYHNHAYEFESEHGKVLYDVLLENTESDLVHMEMDLGWVIVAQKNPIDYFKNFPRRFPLWHLKDMNLSKKQSTEFGKGNLNIPDLLSQAKESGLKYFFIEQEEYNNTPWESMEENMTYLSHL